MKDCLHNEIKVKDFIVVDRGERSTFLMPGLVTEVSADKIKYIYLSWYNQAKNEYSWGKSYTTLPSKVVKTTDQLINKDTVKGLLLEYNKEEQN